jgi:hypothetical protein
VRINPQPVVLGGRRECRLQGSAGVPMPQLPAAAFAG